MARIPLPILIPLVAALTLLVVLAVIGRVPLSYTIRNLVLRWKTTLLTAVAFVVVIGLLTAMLAFVNGMYRLTESSGHPENLIILSDGATDEIFSNLKKAEVGDIENQPGVARSPDGRPLASREVYLVVNQIIRDAPPGKPSRRFLQLRGVEDAPIAAYVHGIELYPGGVWFSQAGVQEAAAEAASGSQAVIQAVLGEGIAGELGRSRNAAERASAQNPNRLEIGDTFALNNRTWLVVGVMQSAGSTFDSEVWAKGSLIGPMFGKDAFTSVVIRCPDPPTAEKLRDYFTKDYKKAALQAQVESDYFASLGNTTQQFLVAVVFVAIVMAIGGVFGVMNTMFAAISQRIKDIGVLRLLGYTRWHVLVAFLLESLLIALVGGLAGCALGSLVDGCSATSVVSSGPGGGKFVVLKLVVDARIIAEGILLTLFMGISGGILPALSAIRLRPLDALR